MTSNKASYSLRVFLVTLNVCVWMRITEHFLDRYTLDHFTILFQKSSGTARHGVGCMHTFGSQIFTTVFTTEQPHNVWWSTHTYSLLSTGFPSTRKDFSYSTHYRHSYPTVTIVYRRNEWRQILILLCLGLTIHMYIYLHEFKAIDQLKSV